MNNTPSLTPSQMAERPGWLSYLLLVAVIVWLVLCTVLVHVGAWFADQVLLIEGINVPWYAWPLISWGHALLLALAVVPLAIFSRAPRFRLVYQTWALAIAFVLVLSLARVFPVTWTQPAELAQIILALVSLIALLVVATMRGRRLAWSMRAVPPVLSLVPLIIFPSLLWGALGSPLDTLLNLLAALMLGIFAGVLLDVFLFQPLCMNSARAGRDTLLAGITAGVALLILGSGFGFGGSQLLLMIVLPPLGFAVAAVARLATSPLRNGQEREEVAQGSAWLPIGLLVGLTAAAPLMFVDPDELSLLLGGDEILIWALRAAGLSFGLALIAGFVLWVMRTRLIGQVPSRRTLGIAGLPWVAAALLYFFVGKPGFYGEQLFVILHEQADLNHAYVIPDRNERTRYVYTTLTQHANQTQANLRATLDSIHADYHPYYLVNAMEVNGGPILRAYLSVQPEVDRILDSPHLRPLPAPVPVSQGDQLKPTKPQWNITSIGADRVWNELGITGKGIVVGQSDSGVQGDHPALRDGYRGRSGQHDFNWLDPWNGTRSPTDIGGHGTHTLGSILGRGGIGVAPGAEWFACVNLARNLGNPPVYLNCMQFMLAPYRQGGDAFKDGDPTLGANVINDSWGCPSLEGCDANSLEPAARALRADGIFVVASAGNEGPRCGSVSDPIAIYADVFSVGAVDEFGKVSFFSSRGPVLVDSSNRVKPDIAAPGVEVLSSFPGNSYAKESGTSMAGPHVVGVVALMWSAQPKLIGNIERTRQILTQTARPYSGQPAECSNGSVPNNAVGYGLVDAYAAVKAALAEK